MIILVVFIALGLTADIYLIKEKPTVEQTYAYEEVDDDSGEYELDDLDEDQIEKEIQEFQANDKRPIPTDSKVGLKIKPERRSGHSISRQGRVPAYLKTVDKR